MKEIIKSIMIMLTLTLAFNKANGQNMESKNHKVVFQLASNDTLEHKALIKQLSNLMKAMEEVAIEVVCHGPGVELMLNNTKYNNHLHELNKKGVRFLVCQNTLKEKKIESSSVLSIAKIIPAGIAHIILRQQEGWSYIKAGF